MSTGNKGGMMMSDAQCAAMCKGGAESPSESEAMAGKHPTSMPKHPKSMPMKAKGK